MKMLNRLDNLQQTDPLYFPRGKLANALLTNLSEGLTHAITLFAPRRMGKTQFLLKDIEPQARAKGFNVFYFSFMDDDRTQTVNAFTESLLRFANKIEHQEGRFKQLLTRVQKIDVLGVGVEVNHDDNQPCLTISQLLNELAEQSDKPILMLLDEVQELARSKKNDGLIRSLRTGLDTNQQKIKVIFTGSSTNGLRLMFNNNKAPFFHFAHSLDFPNLGQEFTDFLADVYHQRTGNQLDKKAFFDWFKRFNFTPLYMRSITQDLIIDPSKPLDDVANYHFMQIQEQSDYFKIWQRLSELERQLLRLLTQEERSLYGQSARQKLADVLGVMPSVSTIQGKLKKLERNELITRDADNSIKINDPHFQTWIYEQI